MGMVVLVKITILMSLAWGLHAALRRTNPRWRVLLWRGAAVGTILIPVVMVFLPALEIHLRLPSILAPTVRSNRRPVGVMRPIGSDRFQKSLPCRKANGRKANQAPKLQEATRKQTRDRVMHYRPRPANFPQSNQ